MVVPCPARRQDEVVGVHLTRLPVHHGDQAGTALNREPQRCHGVAVRPGDLARFEHLHAHVDGLSRSLSGWIDEGEIASRRRTLGQHVTRLRKLRVDVRPPPQEGNTGGFGPAHHAFQHLVVDPLATQIRCLKLDVEFAKRRNPASRHPPTFSV